MRRRWVVSGVRRVRAVPCVRASSSSSSARRESSRARERLNSLNRARCDAFDAPSREISVWYACGVCVVLCVRASRARVKCVAREDVRHALRRRTRLSLRLRVHLNYTCYADARLRAAIQSSAACTSFPSTCLSASIASRWLWPSMTSLATATVSRMGFFALVDV